jgi:hypothetical protein
MTMVTKDSHSLIYTHVHVASVLMSSSLPFTAHALLYLKKQLQMRTFKRYLSHAFLLTTLHPRKMN